MEDILLSVGHSFEKQFQIGPYIVDFLIVPDLVIEVDGSAHIGRKMYDNARDKYLMHKGYKVARFKNNDLLDEGFVVDEIEKWIAIR